MTTMNQATLVRRAEALELTGFKEDEFTKLVNAEVIVPVYLVWQVRDGRNAILFEAPEEKAKAEAERIGGTAEPVGRAYYRREELEKVMGK